MSVMSVWVKSRNGGERAFKVDFRNGMDFDDLMGAITERRSFLNFPAGAVESVHSKNSNEERFILRAGAKVPIPADGQVGSSEDLPYFFSFTRQTQPGVRRSFDDYSEGLAMGMSLASKRARRDTDKTPGAYANSVKQALGRDLVRVGDGDGDPFLTEEESRAARASLLPDRHERFLVAYMTPLLNERLMPGFTENDVLVNSEEYPWIPQSADLKINYLAPDHFIAPHYLVKFRAPYHNAPHIENGEYGIFPVMNAKKSIVAIGDAKKKLDAHAEGEFMKLLECASWSSETLFLRGFVYDCETCVLMTALNGSIAQYTSVKWTAPGSRSLICNYFSERREFQWDEALRTACKALNVRVQRFSTRTHHIDGGKTCILGEGAFGRVFRVTQEGNDPEELALKVVLGEDSCNELGSEFAVASNMSPIFNDVIIRPLPQTLWSGFCGADNCMVSAFLLNHVGEPFHHPGDIYNSDGPQILEALSDLHDGGIAHGDARYKNVVRVFVNGRHQFRWIDLGRHHPGSAILFEKDVKLFFGSMNRYFDEMDVKRYATTTANSAWGSAEERRQCARSLWVNLPLLF